MTNVVQLAGAQPELIATAEDTAVIDDGSDAKAALIAFQEAVETGCSFTDCLAAVFQAGVASVIGAPAKRRVRTPAVPPCPYEKIVELYHALLPELPGVDLSLLNEKRKKPMRERWLWIFKSRRRDGVRRAETTAQALEWLGLYFSKVRSNKFLMGTEGRSGPHKNWKCTIDYLLTDAGMQAVIERTETS